MCERESVCARGKVCVDRGKSVEMESKNIQRTETGTHKNGRQEEAKDSVWEGSIKRGRDWEMFRKSSRGTMMGRSEKERGHEREWLREREKKRERPQMRYPESHREREW